MVDLLQIRQRRAFFDNPTSVLVSIRRVRFSCPCCGYPTLGGRGQDEICELCWWEDDGQDDDNADEVCGGPNRGYSLNDARENFQIFGVKYPPQNDPRIGGPDTEAVRAIKASLISVFDSMMKEESIEVLRERWSEALLLERQLE
jgi:hypothetical protein